ncbi:MAG TPA: hypothetical protein VIT45_17165 [Allosphingosinicella sp.]
MTVTRFGGFMVAAAFALASFLVPPPARAQVRFNHEYVVKVVCGNMERAVDRPLATGRYFTIVNIHNPVTARAYFQRKIVQAGPRTPSTISRWEQFALEYDEALGITCPQITKQATADWVEGFLVIQSSKPLDVVAVYATSGRDEFVTTFHTERVPGRPIE